MISTRAMMIYCVASFVLVSMTNLSDSAVHYGSKAFKSTHGGGGKSITRPLASQRSIPLRTVPLRSAPLRSAPQRAAPLAGSFVSGKVAMS